MIAKGVEYHQDAVTEVKAAVAWYEKRSRRAALDFIEELQRALETIRQTPNRWPMAENNTRRFLLWRFPFRIIYSEEESAFIIWAVAHGSRRPGYWLERLE